MQYVPYIVYQGAFAVLLLPLYSAQGTTFYHSPKATLLIIYTLDIVGFYNL